MREVLQIAKDAALTPLQPVTVVFRIITLWGEDLAAFKAALGWGELRPHYDEAKQGRQKFNTLLKDGLRHIDDNDELLLLQIEDSGTTGLTGPERDQGKFTALCRDNLNSEKSGSSGGAYGLGKAVPWRASRLSTVLFNSHLATPEQGRTMDRILGRCELAWQKCAGEGWFGAIDDDGRAVSHWDNATLAQDLSMRRTGTGTTACVLGFHDASADSDRKPQSLADDIDRHAAENFFPALVAGTLAVKVEVCDSGRDYREARPSKTLTADPGLRRPAPVRMLQALRDGATVNRFGEAAGEVAMTQVTLTVPATARTTAARPWPRGSTGSTFPGNR